MDKWAGGKYSGRVAFVCVSCAGPELASAFVKELKLSKCTVTYTEDTPTWGQLGCSGFIVLDGDGRVASRATAAYLELRERAFDHVESLLDSLLHGAKSTTLANGAEFDEVVQDDETPLGAGACRTASGCALKNTPREEERTTETCAAAKPRSEMRSDGGGGDDDTGASFTAPWSVGRTPIHSLGIAALDAEHAACTAALQQLASTRSVAALEKVLIAYEAHFAHEEALLDTYLWKEAAAAAAGGGSAGGFDKSASMRKSHFADHARMLRELAPEYVEQARRTRGVGVSSEEIPEEIPRTVVESALLDFEAHANRYDSYGDELGAALLRAGESPSAVLALAGV